MGEQDVRHDDDGDALRRFTKRLLRDLRALERMLADGQVESGVSRIGAEQEIFLVDDRWRPAPIALEVIDRLGGGDFTTELARFNLEFNTDPLAMGGDCLRRLEEGLVRRLAEVRAAAEAVGGHAVLAGILPTLTKTDLDLDMMTPVPRYLALNETLTRMRGGPYHFRITGTDELLVHHDSMMVEAANTSFQVHFQVDPERFGRLYNIAQLVSAPVLAAAVNSPLLFGKRLWAETRIALFQQSVDTRTPSSSVRDMQPRVGFGTRWVDSCATEIYREDIARFRVLFRDAIDEDPFEVLAAGGVPRLSALCLHNGTVYRWNRACYGISDGRPHLRIENRVFPAGPTILDSVSNAALWFGLVSGFSDDGLDPRLFSFDDARSNFLAAARRGLDAQFRWLDGASRPVGDLLRDELLPVARRGLESLGIDGADIDRYLGVIDERVACGMTGSRWLIQSYESMGNVETPAERMTALTAALAANQSTGRPVHEWPMATAEAHEAPDHFYGRVDQIMRTDLLTVKEDDVVDLAANLMDWERVRHVPVENDNHQLIGLVTQRMLLRLVAQGLLDGRSEPVAVSEIMDKDPVTITPQTTTLEAIERMRIDQVGCLPVVDEEGHLVGLVTEKSFMEVSARLLQKHLRP